MKKNSEYDVIVVGAGPAGTCLAGNLARQGVKVLIVEGKAFPRHHIGESLLAMSMPLLNELGVVEKLREEGFLQKTGSVFIWGSTQKQLSLLMPHPGYAFQVVRERFDQILLDHAKELGADVLQEWWVRQPLWSEEGRVRGVLVEGKDGVKQEIVCRYVVDASGLSQFFPRRLNLPIRLDGPKRIALSAYVKGALRADPPHETNIISEAAKDGWLWFIPLNDELTSVGFVGDACDLQGNPQAFIEAQIASTRVLKEKMKHSSFSQEAQVLNYTNHMVDAPLWKDGYVLIGDSAIFVDPLFSTGVHGALYSGTLAASGLVSLLAGEAEEAEVAAWYEQHVKSHYNRVNETVKLLYGIHPGTSRFWTTRNQFGISEEEAEQTAQRLGSQGMAFFVNAMNDGVLELPEPLKNRVREFVLQVSNVKPLADDAIPCLAPEMEKVESLVRDRGRLVHGFVILHRRNRTIPVEFKANGYRSLLIQAIDGKRTVGELLEELQMHPNGIEPRQKREAALFLGALMQAGVLRMEKQQPSGVQAELVVG